MTHIWVPRCKILEPRRELITPKSRVAGMFKLEAIRPDGRRRLLADWFPNLITNAGLNRIGTANDYMGACRVGSGSATPSVLDTNLQSHVAGTSTEFTSNRSAQGSAPYYSQFTRVYRFATGAAAGNLQEIGIATSTGNGTGVLFSRALILDGSGNPTTITVLSDEVLDATYQVRLYPPLSDVVDSVDISGSSYNITIRAMSVTSTSFWAMPALAQVGLNSARFHDGAIGAITSSPAGSSVLVNCTAASYSDNSLQRDGTMPAGLTEANFVGGIESVSMYFGQPGGNAVLGSLQCGFSPAIPKDSTMTLSLTFRVAWDRGSI